MFKVSFLLLAALVSCYIAEPLPRLEGRRASVYAASIVNFPWQVLVLAVDPSDDSITMCGGAIYDQNHIITAAHCVAFADSNDVVVQTGSAKPFLQSRVFKVAAIEVHEDYKAATKTGTDIALLRLAKSLTFSSSIQSIPLASKEPVEGSLAYESDWGVTSMSKNAELPRSLRYTTVQILNSAKCTRQIRKYDASLLNSPVFCAYGSARKACLGDSGAPLVLNGQLIGIVSQGIGCGVLGMPAVYTDVAQVRNWIQTKAGQADATC